MYDILGFQLSKLNLTAIAHEKPGRGESRTLNVAAPSSDSNKDAWPAGKNRGEIESFFS